MKEFRTILLSVFGVVMIVLAVGAVLLVRDIRTDLHDTKLNGDLAFATLNRTLGEQEAYFKKEQDVLNSPEVQQSLALGLRSLRNLDKSSIGLAQSMAHVQSMTEQLARSVPATVVTLNQEVLRVGQGVESGVAQFSAVGTSLDRQISSTGVTLQDDLSSVKPVMQDLDRTVVALQSTVGALTSLVQTPSITSSFEHVDTATMQLAVASANVAEGTALAVKYEKAALAPASLIKRAIYGVAGVAGRLLGW